MFADGAVEEESHNLCYLQELHFLSLPHDRLTCGLEHDLTFFDMIPEAMATLPCTHQTLSIYNYVVRLLVDVRHSMA